LGRRRADAWPAGRQIFQQKIAKSAKKKTKMMFADAIDSVSPAVGWNFILILIVALGAVANWIQIADRRKVQERRVSFEAEFASKESVGEIKETLKTFQEAVKQDVDGLHNRITDIGREVSEAATETRLVNQSLAQLSVEVRNRRVVDK
jgi:hypothetical protein